MPDSQKQTDAAKVRWHSQEIQSDLADLIAKLRANIDEIEDPRAEALFETTAEVMEGLRTAYRHYDERAEEAWR